MRLKWDHLYKSLRIPVHAEGLHEAASHSQSCQARTLLNWESTKAWHLRLLSAVTVFIYLKKTILDNITI